MTEKIIEFPDRRAIEEEAGAWLIRLDGDSPLSTDERASLREWLQRSTVHREELESLATLWEKTNVLTELAVPLGRPERSRGGRFGLRRTSLVGVTAVVVLVGIGLVTAIWFRSDPYLASNGLYATAVGQQQSTELADGSVVLLNTDSQIKVSYGDQFRDIRLLQGEAHFTVAKDRKRPFRVFAGAGRVEAVGTAFSVYLKANAVDVTVTEGKVELASVRQIGSGSIYEFEAGSDRPSGPGETATIDNEDTETFATLRAGQSASMPRLPQGAGSIQSVLEEIQTVEAPEMAKRLSWREGVLTFAGDPLENVVEEISRYTTISIEISDPAIRATRIGGRFPVGETDAMFDALETNFGLRVIRLSHDRVLLSAAED